MPPFGCKLGRTEPRTTSPRHQIVILAGPNGAGKTTVAPALLRDLFGIQHFVNADVIAQGLSGFDPPSAAAMAGRIMLDQILTLADQRANFAFETTLASRSLVSRIREWSTAGYEVQLAFLALPSVGAAIQRVASRVRCGGHDVPIPVIERRFSRGLKNLFQFYLPIVHRWRVFDAANQHQLLATGGRGLEQRVIDPIQWSKLESLGGNP